VKVGGRPVEEDVARVNALLGPLGPGERIRLDANQAWGLEDAARFVQGLTRPEAVEYIEEPCQDPLCLPELFHCTERRVRFALDESLAVPPRPLSELVGMPGLAALVLKPTVLGGLSACLDLDALAAAKGLAAVVSSSFESSIGLCHLTLLGSVLNHPSPSASSAAAAAAAAAAATEDGASGATLHGLATYTAFAEEPMLLRSGFGDLVCPGARSQLVDVLGCQELLDAHVRRGRDGGNGGGGSRSSSPATPDDSSKAGAPERAGMENGHHEEQPTVAAPAAAAAGAATAAAAASSSLSKRQGSP
jgi:hypothetical protein